MKFPTKTSSENNQSIYSYCVTFFVYIAKIVFMTATICDVQDKIPHKVSILSTNVPLNDNHLIRDPTTEHRYCEMAVLGEVSRSHGVSIKNSLNGHFNKGLRNDGTLVTYLLLSLLNFRPRALMH